MKAQDVVGRKIVAFKQTRRGAREDEKGRKIDFVWDVDGIVLDDGSMITFNVKETDFGEYYIEASTSKP